MIKSNRKCYVKNFLMDFHAPKCDKSASSRHPEAQLSQYLNTKCSSFYRNISDFKPSTQHVTRTECEIKSIG